MSYLTDEELPPLPKVDHDAGWHRQYTSDQMREYARAAIAAYPRKHGEPVADKWEGGEGWESLAWELCADEHGEEACNELVWEGGPIPEPWGDRWMKYEDEAKRLIALVYKHTAPPLTDQERQDASMWNWLVNDSDGNVQDDFIHWLAGNVASRAEIEAWLRAAMSKEPGHE